MKIPTTFKFKKMNKLGKEREKIALIDNILSKTLDRVIRITGATVKVTGAENVPLNEPVLFVGNHQGNMDIPLLYITSPQKMGFVAKKEFEKIPVFGYWMKERNCVFMDRGNAKESLKSINQAIDILKRGHSIAIFPEGTRSKKEEMGDFKAGSLRIALKAGVKVVPVTFKGSYKLMEETGKVTPSKVNVHYSHPIDAKEFTDTNKLAEAVLAEIKKHM